MGDRHLIRRSVTAYAALNVKQATRNVGGQGTQSTRFYPESTGSGEPDRS